MDFPGGKVVKKIHLPVQEMQEMWVRFLGREDPLEKEMFPGENNHPAYIWT